MHSLLLAVLHSLLQQNLPLAVPHSLFLRTRARGLEIQMKPHGFVTTALHACVSKTSFSRCQNLLLQTFFGLAENHHYCKSSELWVFACSLAWVALASVN